MDDEHCLISSVINVDHHFLNENPCKSLLRAYIGARRIPYRRQVVSKGHQGGPVNLWTGSCTCLQTGDAMFQSGHPLECGVPTRFQFSGTAVQNNADDFRS